MANILEPSSLLRMRTAWTDNRDIAEDMLTVFSQDAGALKYGDQAVALLDVEMAKLPCAEPRLNGCHGVVWWGTRLGWIFFGISIDSAPKEPKVHGPYFRVPLYA